MPNIRLKRYTGAAWENLDVQTEWAQILNKPTTFTPTAHTHVKADITDFGHTHGNISNTGTITSTTVTPADQDRILIADNSASGSIERGIIIGTSTTTFLRNDGQWTTPAGGGTVTGPGTTTVGNFPRWNNTTGTLLDTGLSLIDSTSAAALGTNQALVTERDIYYGTPTINNSKAYTSSTTIYAPITGQTSSYFLVGNGTTSAPTWRFLDSDWETADQALTAATDVLSISIPAAGTYKVFMSGAYYSTSTTIGVQIKFTFSGTLSTTPDSSFNITGSQNAAASNGDLHNEVAMNVALTTTSVSAINTNHGMSAMGQFTCTTSGTFSLNIAPETGSTSVGVAEGTLLHVEQVI
jgi:hypothetical protein